MGEKHEVILEAVDDFTVTMRSMLRQLDDVAKATRNAASATDDASSQITGFLKRYERAYALVASAATGTMLEIIRTTPLLMGSMVEIRYAFEELAIIVGDEMAPAFDSIADSMWDYVDWVESLPKPLRQVMAVLPLFATNLGGIALTLQIGVPLLRGLAGGLAGSGAAAAGGAVGLGSFLLPLLAIIGAIVTFAWLYSENIAGFRDQTNRVFSAAGEVVNGFIDILNSLGFDIESVDDIVEGFTETMRGLFKFIADFLEPRLLLVADVMHDIADTIREIRSWGGGGGGGGVPGTPTYAQYYNYSAAATVQTTLPEGAADSISPDYLADLISVRLLRGLSEQWR